MFLQKMITTSTAGYSAQIDRLKNAIDTAEAIFIGAGAGLSTAAGLTYDGEWVERYFPDFIKKYGISDMYSGGFYPYDSLEEYWVWWSRQIYINRYDAAIGKPYVELLEMIEGKEYFVLTTNVDHQFQLAGFDKRRLFYTQGDCGLFQCSKACHDKTYDNEEIVWQMVAQQTDMKIPTQLVPRCPVCGNPMTMNLRVDHTFVQDKGWYEASERYAEFVCKYQGRKALLLELGVGGNTPAIIKYSFWQMAEENRKAIYACINLEEAACPSQIAQQSICIEADIRAALSDVKNIGLRP